MSKGDRVYIGSGPGIILEVRTAGRHFAIQTPLRYRERWLEVVELTRGGKPSGLAFAAPLAQVAYYVLVPRGAAGGTFEASKP